MQRFGAGLIIFALVFACGLDEPAAAKDEDIVGPDTPPASPASEVPDLDVAFGFALTSDYVSRGITNSANKPAMQGYIEPNYGMGYVGVWSSNVDYGAGFKGAEIDVGGGIRPSIGSLSLDLGYVHYFYSPQDVSPDYGEFYAKADYDVDGKVTLGARVFFAPDYNQSGETATFVAGGIRIPLPHDFSAYGGIGYQFFEDPDAFEQLAWTAGITYSLKAVSFDLRYWDTNLSEGECAVRSGFSDGCDARVVGTFSIGFTSSELMK